MSSILLNIRKGQTPVFKSVKRLIKGLLAFSIPSVRFIHLPLYHLHGFVLQLVKFIYQGVWAVPLFKARCFSCGIGLKLPNGIPYISGSNLQIIVGDNTMILRSTLAAGHVHERPHLLIGDRVTIGYGTSISCSLSVRIGDDTLLAGNCFIADNNGHPISPERRLRHEAVNKDEIKSVYIGKNCWIGTNSAILRGVTIGDNSIIAGHSVVTKDVPPNSIFRNGNIETITIS